MANQPAHLFYRAMRLAGMSPRAAWRLRSTVVRCMADHATVDVTGVALLSPRQLEVPMATLVAGGPIDEYGRDTGRWEYRTFTITPPRSVAARYLLPRGWAESTL